MSWSGRPCKVCGPSMPAADPPRTLQIALIAMAVGAISGAEVVSALVGQPTEDRYASIASQTSVGAKTYLDDQSSTAHAVVGRTADGDIVKSTASASPSVTSASTVMDPFSLHTPDMQVIVAVPKERDPKQEVPSSPIAAEPQADLTRDKEPEKAPVLADVPAKPQVDVTRDKEPEKPAPGVDRKVNPYKKMAVRKRQPPHWPF